MYKIQTLNTIAAIGLEQFPRDLYEVSSELQHPDAILVRSHNMHDMQIPDTVRVVGRAGAGVNNIPVHALTQRGIPVLNTPGANANAVRELVLAGMFLASRHICQAVKYVTNLTSEGPALIKQIEQDKNQFVGFELLGKTLGVVGLGSIGVKVANAALNLGMRVIGYDPTITVSRAWELSSNVLQARNLDEVLMQADFVTFHIPLSDETKHLVNSSRLANLKTGAVILNFAREEIIDHEALAVALNEKKVLSYVTDFPNDKIKNCPQVIALPHLGASTREAEENCAVMIVKQIRDFLEQGSIGASVNFPAIEMPKTANSFRLAISNLNIPNMVAQISVKLAEANLNIVSFLNKSQQDIAYTLIDVNQPVTDQLVQALCDIEGVIQVRKVY